MLRLLNILALTILFAQCSYSQKKQISEARSLIKSMNNLEKAESSMRELLKDSINRSNIKIYLTLADAIHARYNSANEQFYLKQKTDTIKLFKTTRDMFKAYEMLDSIDCSPNKNGKIKIKYRKKNAIGLNTYRPNLYNGGLFFLNKKAYEDAYDLFDTYLECAKQPLFKELKYTLNDTISQSAAFWTVFCGFKMNKPELSYKYKDIALDAKNYRQETLKILTECYKMQNDTTNYINTLKIGFYEFPESQFFFTRIIDNYNDNGCYKEALQIANEAVLKDSLNTLFLYGKSNALLNLGRYEDCLNVCKKILEINDTLPNVYYNAGISYINMAVLIETSNKIDKEMRNKIKSYYKMALPYMEKFRELAPKQQEKWALSLYSIYLKLNMGTQFEEISNILRLSNNNLKQ